MSQHIVVFGSSGMLGSEVLKVLLAGGHDVRSPLHQDFDLRLINNLDRMRRTDFGHFDWVINCAAYTAVDKAESNVYEAMHMNGVIPGALAAICAENGWKYMHISTDYVFDGTSPTPYTEESPTHPVNVYGRSKLEGEKNALANCSNTTILRTSWLYGSGGACFPQTMIRAFEKGNKLAVVADQKGCPTYAPHLASVIGKIVETGITPGIYHATGQDVETWHSFAKTVLKAWALKNGKDSPRVGKLTTDEYPTPAKRPQYSVLDNAKLNSLGFGPMPSLAEAVSDYVSRFTLPLEPS